MTEERISGHVVIVGAGIVGACCAIEALRDGWQVTILDCGEPGGVQSASYGNGGWISPASVVPMSMPGLWRKVPGYLVDPLGPLAIRWTSLPRLLPWLLRYLRAGSTVEKVEAVARKLAALLSDAPARHAALAQEAGVAHLLSQSGLLYAYSDRSGFEAEALSWRLRRDNGVSWVELSTDELRQAEPTLGAQYGFGVRVDAGAHCIDPGAYVAALVAHAESLGARYLLATAQGFTTQKGRLHSVRTSGGSIDCDRAVIAAGIASAGLARKLGDVVPLASERGYHVEIADPEPNLCIPVMPSDGKMANTPMRCGLRAAGQVEVAVVGAPPNWQRAEVLLHHLRRTYFALPAAIDEARITRWMGHRPSTPDSLPVIAPARRCGDVVYAFGHGHVGLAAGPITGRLVADILAGHAAPKALAATRF